MDHTATSRPTHSSVRAAAPVTPPPPPLPLPSPRAQTEREWEHEFSLYKGSPEFRRVHSGITLDDFKFIFYMEYAHRMWGRALGLAAAAPGAAFAYLGYLTPALGLRMACLFAAGGAQAFVGWWMVRSGLEEPRGAHDMPRVSPYRLATHLAVAFGIYTGLLWTTLQLAYPTAAHGMAEEAMRAARRLRWAAGGLAALVGATALSGAFVAGLDAGRCYNTFPLMDGRLFPEAYWGQGEEGPGGNQGGRAWWRNAFENPAAVQFHHRCLAVGTLCGALAMFSLARSLGPALPRPARAAAHAVVAVATCQVRALGRARMACSAGAAASFHACVPCPARPRRAGPVGFDRSRSSPFGSACWLRSLARSPQVALGIWTLLSAVPVSLGSLHQARWGTPAAARFSAASDASLLSPAPALALTRAPFITPPRCQAGALTLFSATVALLHTLRPPVQHSGLRSALGEMGDRSGCDRFRLSSLVSSGPEACSGARPRARGFASRGPLLKFPPFSLRVCSRRWRCGPGRARRPQPRCQQERIAAGPWPGGPGPCTCARVAARDVDGNYLSTV